MKKYEYIIIALILIGVTIGCNDSKTDKNKKPIAKVFDKYLYAEDIASLLNENTSSIDSAVKVSNFVDIWVKKQLMMVKAEQYLSDDQKDVEKQLEDYRSSLLIYKYKQKFIDQKLDTNISRQEIDEYYLIHSQDFKLAFNAIKGIFVKILKNNKDASKVKFWIQSNSPIDSANLHNYCIDNSIYYNNYNGDWVAFSDIITELPSVINDQKDFLRSRRNIYIEDENFFYYVKVVDFKLSGDISPIIFVQSSIQNILLNKRKIMLINELENTIYQNAINQGNLVFYNQK